MHCVTKTLPFATGNFRNLAETTSTNVVIANNLFPHTGLGFAYSQPKTQLNKYTKPYITI